MINIVEYRNRWTLITGASRGIGKRISYEMADKGSNLVLISRDKAHTLTMEKELSLKGVQVISYGVELSQSISIEKMLEDIENKGIEIDTVFNVAAVNSNIYDYFSTSMNEYEMIFKVNVFAIGQICNWFIPKMLKRGFGRIINITSDIKNEPKAMVYASSKAAIDKLTMEMAYALNGSNIMINLADPGWVRTDMGTKNAPNDVDSCIPGILLGAFLNDHVNGRTIHTYEYSDMSLEDAVNKITDKSKNAVCVKATSLDDFQEVYRDYITSTKKHLVFGGGRQAQFCIDVLKYLGVLIDGIVVSRNNEMKYFDDIPMYEVNSIPFDVEECAIIVAIVENGIEAVSSMLLKNGFEDIHQFRVAYSKGLWLEKNNTLVSQAFEEKRNTFEGGGI